MTVEMVDEPIEPQDVPEDVSQAVASSGRERSLIKFPYGDLTGAMEVVTAVNKYGLSCSTGQLAAALGLDAAKAMFRTRVSAAQTFGLVQSTGTGVKLTTLGRSATDPAKVDSALVEAFLNVPLYRHVFELFDGTVLPSDGGLEAEMVNAGVARKQVQRARQVFVRSADRAGFFRAGRGRLVRPGVGIVAAEERTPQVEAPGTDSSHGGEATKLSKDPLLVGLFERLPNDAPFPLRDRERWVRTFLANLDMVYGDAKDEARTSDASADRP